MSICKNIRYKIVDFTPSVINIQSMKNLFLYLISIINSAKKCSHTRALLNSDEGYCPDCGVYLKKYYYVLRCKCCSHKREAARAVFGKCDEIVPVSKFCPVCGGEEFYIERYEKLNITDICYAIEVKEIYNNECIISSTKVWVETEDDSTTARHPQTPATLTASPDIPRLKALIS